jgi:hypothetical protein
VVPSRKSTGKLPRRGRSGKGKWIRRQQPLHISARIPATIAILMASLRKSVGNYIHS